MRFTSLIILIIAILMTFISSFNCHNKRKTNFSPTNYDGKELRTNFLAKEKEIMELFYFFKSIVPSENRVSIIFEGRDDEFTFAFSFIDSISGIVKSKHGSRKVIADSEEMDSLLKLIGWNKEDFNTIKERLIAANCIGLHSGNPTQIIFGHGKPDGMSLYSYLVFGEETSDSLFNLYLNQESTEYFKDRVLFQYQYPF